MDLSDGLADAARQIAVASGLGVVVDAEAVPVHETSAARCTASGSPAWANALSGGEDYELLFAVPPRRRRAFLAALKRSGGLAATCIGRLTAESGEWLQVGAIRRPLPSGFAHFLQETDS
jgi:thiamine-monophosphate kinase